MNNNNNPTTEQFLNYQKAYDYFNEYLFGGELKPCLLNFSRKNKVYGFFARERWFNEENNEYTHEISLNPDILDRPLDHTFATLVHEMCHQWHYDYGEKPSKIGYHNKEWANKMLEVGLIPDDGTGKMTGYRVSHRIDENGMFKRAFENMPNDIKLVWKSSSPFTNTQKKKEKNKVKYTCPYCDLSVWGKPNIHTLRCACLADDEGSQLNFMLPDKN